MARGMIQLADFGGRKLPHAIGPECVKDELEKAQWKFEFAAAKIVEDVAVPWLLVSGAFSRRFSKLKISF
jgi:hypothetical protein